jgi:hypothetical protein
MTKKLKKITAEKIFNIEKENWDLLIPRPP